MLNNRNFPQGKWICCPSEVKENLPRPDEILPYNSKLIELLPGKGLPTFYKDFEIGSLPKNAIINISSLGIFDLFVNDRRVGHRNNNKTIFDELKPGWTDYKKRVLYYTYDIKPFLVAGKNRIKVRVSNGWWSGRVSFGYYGFLKNALIADLIIEHQNEVQIISTDERWNSAITGPILTTDIWDGEYYDATIEDKSPHNLEAVQLFTIFDGELTPAEEPYVRIRTPLVRKADKVTLYRGILDDGSDYGKINRFKIENNIKNSICKLSPGETAQFDFGQNLVGWPRIFLRAKRGTKVKFYFSEQINDSGMISRGSDGPEGSVYLANYRTAKSRLVYICSGYKTEVYAPSHSFFGFQFLEIEADNELIIEDIQAEPVGSDIHETGIIITSNGEVNKLFSNILWGQRGNFLSVPTDCPQRDERVGWTGDTQIFCGAAAFNADVKDFFKKWLRDLRDSQYNKSIGDVVPRIAPPSKHESRSAWADACIIVPYKMYKMYGDISFLEEQYESMESYMEHLSDFGLEGGATDYGDWLGYEDTDKRYIAIAYYANNAHILEKVSDILGKSARADYYSLLRERIIERFKSEYIENGLPTIKSQTALILALQFNLIDEVYREKIITLLTENIINNGYKLSTGFVGTGLIMQTLSESKMHDLAYSLLLQTDDPSWLYSVRQGATTIWERWNSYTKEKGFGNVNMNSFNHYAYGAIAEWMYLHMVGISPKDAGFKEFILQPSPDFRDPNNLPEGQDKITRVRGEYESDFGLIVSEWENKNNLFSYRFVVPESSKAYVKLHNNGNKFSYDFENYNIDETEEYISFILESGIYTIKEIEG